MMNGRAKGLKPSFSLSALTKDDSSWGLGVEERGKIKDFNTQGHGVWKGGNLIFPTCHACFIFPLVPNKPSVPSGFGFTPGSAWKKNWNISIKLWQAEERGSSPGVLVGKGRTRLLFVDMSSLASRHLNKKEFWKNRNGADQSALQSATHFFTFLPPFLPIPKIHPENGGNGPRAAGELPTFPLGNQGKVCVRRWTRVGKSLTSECETRVDTALALACQEISASLSSLSFCPQKQDEWNEPCDVYDTLPLFLLFITKNL